MKINGVCRTIVFQRITGGAVFNDVAIIEIAGLFHPSGHENVFPQKIGVSFARRVFDDDREQIIAGIVVSEFFAGREFERLVSETPDHFFVRMGKAIVS